MAGTDTKYELKRNKLIPAAEKVAYQVAGKKPLGLTDTDQWVATWNRTFHDTMNMLARKKKLVCTVEGMI